MPIVRRRDLITALHRCLRLCLMTTGNLDVPITVRLSHWHMANEVQVLLRDA